MTITQLPLSNDWQVKQRNSTLALEEDFSSSGDWLPAQAPGTVHEALLAAGRIPDPFIGLNESEVQWVGEVDWFYRCAFDLSTELSSADIIVLVCEGLDTFATVWLNGSQVLVSDNMFVPHRIPITSLLHTGRNELRILFESAWQRGKALEQQYGAPEHWNGDVSRLYVRKAQYHYGWDWGPKLLTAGPWRAVRLEAYTARIADLYCPAEVAHDLQSATLPVSVTLENAAGPERTLQIALYNPAGELVREVLMPATGDTASYTFELDSPRLWWPHGYGVQSLYRLVATLQEGTIVLDEREQRIGLRRLRLVQEPLDDLPGTSFYFEVNKTPIFCGGANWIPADSFTTRITPERYRQWVQLAADANMVMLRVWGGGIYEEEAFYASCDELGLLVWQDFLFACGLYQVPDWFQESVRIEAEAALLRLRHHPCLALWCGNNEDHMLAGKRYNRAFEGDFTQTEFPARLLYERLLPDICARLDPTRPYWPGSPFGGEQANDLTVGDQHIWSIWHGMVPYQDYYKFSGRFISEFGMQGFPNLTTINEFTSPEERYPQSCTLDWHNKNATGSQRLAWYINENIKTPRTLEEHIYATQFIQAEALASGVRGWRRRWGGPDRYATSGALIWQLDDCWPVTSWAIVDYHLRPKAAYYVVKRELAEVALGLARASEGQQAEVWAVSSLISEVRGELELKLWMLDGTLISAERQHITLAPNQASALGDVALPQQGPVVLAARLFLDGFAVARAALWPEPFKYLALPDPGLKIDQLAQGTLQVSAQRPAKGVLLSTGDAIVLSDNMLDVMPDDPQIIIAPGLLEETQVQATCLQSWP